MKKDKVYLIIILIFILIALLFTFPVITKMHTSIYGPVYGTDYRGAIRHCWWVGYAFRHHLDWRKDNMVNYPSGEIYDWPIFSPLWQLVAYPLTIFLNEQFAFNFLFILSLVLSGITMFLLVFYITNDYKSSFIAGLIYSFCPYHFNKIWEHLGIALIEWMPLYILCLLRLKRHRSPIDIILCAISFSLVIFSEYYYAYFMAIFTVGFVFYLLFYHWKIKLYSIFKNRGSDFKTLLAGDIKIIISVTAVIVVALFFTLPATLSIFKTIIFAGSSESAVTQGFVRSFSYLFSQSARPLNYILPASVHPVFGGFTKSQFGSLFYGRGPIEQTLYLGYIPLLLAFVAYKTWKNNKSKCNLKERNLQIPDDFVVGFFIFSAIFAFFFSMPPYFNLGFFKIYFPPYFTYNLFPMFRAYARFGVVVMLAISVLSGIGLNYIFQRINSTKKRFVLTIVLTFLILFEFSNIPPSHVTDLSRPPAVYQWLQGEGGDFVIAEYPIEEGGGEGGETPVDLDYLFYQRVHQKRMINGALPGTRAYLIKNKIRKIYNPQTPGILKFIGVRYVVVHLDKYKSGTYAEATDIKGDIPDLKKRQGLKFINKFDNVEVYEVVANPVEPKI